MVLKWGAVTYYLCCLQQELFAHFEYIKCLVFVKKQFYHNCGAIGRVVSDLIKYNVLDAYIVKTIKKSQKKPFWNKKRLLLLLMASEHAQCVLQQYIPQEKDVCLL